MKSVCLFYQGLLIFEKKRHVSGAAFIKKTKSCWCCGFLLAERKCYLALNFGCCEVNSVCFVVESLLSILK